jgi:hypothetical protein
MLDEFNYFLKYRTKDDLFSAFFGLKFMRFLSHSTFEGIPLTIGYQSTEGVEPLSLNDRRLLVMLFAEFVASDEDTQRGSMTMGQLRRGLRTMWRELD